MNAKTTKKTKARTAASVTVREPALEYRLDYKKSRPNRFAKRVSRGTVVVVLDSDVARVFRDAKQVNALLRATIAAVDKPRTKRTG